MGKTVSWLAMRQKAEKEKSLQSEGMGKTEECGDRGRERARMKECPKESAGETSGSTVERVSAGGADKEEGQQRGRGDCEEQSREGGRKSVDSWAALLN